MERLFFRAASSAGVGSSDFPTEWKFVMLELSGGSSERHVKSTRFSTA